MSEPAPEQFPEPPPERYPITGFGPLDSDNDREYARFHAAWLGRKRDWEEQHRV